MYVLLCYYESCIPSDGRLGLDVVALGKRDIISNNTRDLSLWLVL